MDVDVDDLPRIGFCDRVPHNVESPKRSHQTADNSKTPEEEGPLPVSEKINFVKVAKLLHSYLFISICLCRCHLARNSAPKPERRSVGGRTLCLVGLFITYLT
jgi:hypothetical protein